VSNEQKISGKTFDLDVFKRILKQAKVYKWPYFITGLLAVLLSFLASARPMLLIEAVNTYIAPKEEKGLLFLILLMLGLLIAGSHTTVWFCLHGQLVGTTRYQGFAQRKYLNISCILEWLILTIPL
jgi:ABC-type multidrug transport system fused ATPase/permease subunit